MLNESDKLAEQCVEKKIVEENVRAQLQKSLSCPCKGLAAAGDVQAISEDKEQQKCCLLRKMVIEFRVYSGGGCLLVLQVTGDGIEG
ncbi:hypothetical protein BGW38_008404, partial [Lunasporangiospora selenospora]